MTDSPQVQLLPYSLIVGQENLKLSLELAYIAPRIGGVLISGQRGTAKSTAARAFSNMMFERLPVTLPINATEDRVIGGWDIDALMSGDPRWKPGLLQEADNSLLYIDEVNLLDDHIVNLILDVTSTGILDVQRDGHLETLRVSFTLVGTMNPEEGGLRPQLLDRFGLLANVRSETSQDRRRDILQRVLDFDEALVQVRSNHPSQLMESGQAQDRKLRQEIQDARQRLYQVKVPREMVEICAGLARKFSAEGHRGDYVMALAARAYAARKGAPSVTTEDIRQVAPLALHHRRPEFLQNERALWDEADDQRLERFLRDDSPVA